MSSKPYHDRFARFNLSDPHLARDFLETMVDDPRLQATNLDALSLASDAHINSRLGEMITDLLYRAPFRDHEAYVSVLVEHKSQGALGKTNFPFLLRKQEMAVMEKAARIHEADKMPSVVMVGIYHGKTPYRGPTMVAEQIDAPEAFIPNHWKADGSVIIDLSAYSDSFLDQVGGRLSVFLLLLKHIYDDNILDTVRRLMPQLQQMEMDHREFILSIFTYLYGASRVKNQEEIGELAVQSFKEETRSAIMTIAEQLEEKGLKKGIEQGIEQGIERGIEQEQKNIVLTMLAEAFPLETIARITKMPLDEIKALAQDHGRA